MGGLTRAFDALPFLAMVSPLIGAISVAIVSRWNAPLSRPMALSNASLTVLLLCAAIWHYDPQRVDDRGRPEATQMEVSLDWLTVSRASRSNVETPEARGLDVRLSFAMDGLTIWPSLWLALVIWIAMWLPDERANNTPAAYYGCLFLCETSLLGSLIAQDVIVSLISFEMTLPSLYGLIGTWGEGNRRSVAGRFLGWQLVGCGLMLLGTTLIAVSWPWMRSDLIARRNAVSFDGPLLIDSMQALLARSETAVQVWSDVAPWGLPFLLLAFAIRLPMFPFQSWYVSGLAEAPVGAAMVMAVGLPQVALCTWLRFGMPLFVVETSVLSGLLGAIGVLGAWSAGLLAFAQRDLKKLVVLLSTGLLSVALLGLWIPSRESLAGAWLLVQVQGLTLVAMLLWVQVLQTRFRSRDVDILRGMTFRQPALTALLMATTGATLFGIATSLFLILSSLISESIVFAASILAAILSMGYIALRTLTWCACATAADDRPTYRGSSALPVAELAPLAPFALLLLLIGLAPAIVLERSEPSLSRLLERVERLAAPTTSARLPSPSLEQSSAQQTGR